MRCFQKNPNLRTSAKKLRKHNWITNFVNKGSQKAISTARTAVLDYDDAVTSVQEYNQKVNGPDLVARIPKRTKSPDKQTAKKVTKSPTKSSSSQMQRHVETGEEDWAKDLEFKSGDCLQRQPLKLRSTTLAVLTPPSRPINTERDAARGAGAPNKGSQLALKLHAPRLTTRQSMPNVPGRIEIARLPGPMPPTRRKSPDQRSATDDMTIRPSSAQLARHVPVSAPSTPVTDRYRDASLFKLPAIQAEGDLTPRRLQRSRTTASAINLNGNRKSALALQQFADDGEDYSDIVGELLPHVSALSSKSNSARYSEKSWMQDDDVGEDPFAEIEEFEKENLTANVLREQKARAIQQMEQLIKDFQGNSRGEVELIRSARDMLALLRDHPDLKSTVIASHGLLPLLETLEASTEDELILVILEVINSLAINDDEVQENM